MYSLTRSQIPLSKSQCFFGRGASFAYSESNRIRRNCSSRIRCPKHCAVSVASKEDASQTHGSPKPYSNRLQSNPAYQRLKARKLPPQETGAPTTSTPPTEEADVSSQAPETDETEASPRPAPGLGHRLKDRPVGRQGPTTAQSRQAPSPAPSEAQAMPQHPSQAPTQQPRAALQPLSALPNVSQAATPSQVPVRHADFAGAQQQDQKSVANVQFWLTFHAEFGQRLRVVGSHKNLGSWIMVDGPELKWTEGDKWHAAVSLPSGGVYEYKYVLLDSTGLHALNWQRGNNSVLAVKQDEGELEVFDNWEGQPGAAVTAGGKSSTRESKLLAWATDIEGQLGLQRQELRRSRVELASAQEDARRARQEARAVRMELAQSQTVRAQADKLIRELQSSNRLLKSELQATATSFKQALHVAQTMLDTAEEREDSISESARQATEATADPTLTPPTTRSHPDQPPSEQQVVRLATSTAAQVESTSPPTTADDAIRSGALEVQKQEAEPSTAETSSSEGAEEDEASGRGAQISTSGMLGSVAESTTSSNARQQSTSSLASSRPTPVSQAASSVGDDLHNTQAGHPSSASGGFFDSSPTSASPSTSAEAQAPQQGSSNPPQQGSSTPPQQGSSNPPQQGSSNPFQQGSNNPPQQGSSNPPQQGSSNRPQSLEDLPKHSTSPDEDTAASPPKAPGGFPDSDQPSQLHRSSSQPAGKQLETARTAVPVQVDRSNAAAASPTATTNGEQKSAGEQLQPARNAVPTDIQDSNAATSQVSTAPSASSDLQDQGSGVELESRKNTVPLDVQGSNAEASEMPTADSQSDVAHAGGDGEGVAAGEQLLQGKQAVPEPPNETNAAANSSRKAKKKKKKSLRRKEL